MSSMQEFMMAPSILSEPNPRATHPLVGALSARNMVSAVRVIYRVILFSGTVRAYSLSEIRPSTLTDDEPMGSFWAEAKAKPRDNSTKMKTMCLFNVTSRTAVYISIYYATPGWATISSRLGIGEPADMPEQPLFLVECASAFKI